MPRDYKNTRRQATREAAPRWPYFGFGLLLGLSVSAGLFLFEHETDRSVSAPAQQTAAVAVEPEAVVSEAPKTRFDFYQVLPEMEIAVEEEPVAAAAPVVEGGERNPMMGRPFVIQVASFRELADADSVKASLALLGLEGHIQTVSIKGETWHRVRLGPFDEVDGLNDARARLYANHFDAQVY